MQFCRKVVHKATKIEAFKKVVAGLTTTSDPNSPNNSMTKKAIPKTSRNDSLAGSYDDSNTVDIHHVLQSADLLPVAAAGMPYQLMRSVASVQRIPALI